MFYSLFAHHAHTNPAKIAVVNEGRTITYGELDALIQRCARNLLAQGIGQGTLVAACFDNNIEYLALYYALARVGACVAPLSVTLSTDDLVRYCTECEPKYYLVQERYLASYQEVARRVGSGTVISESTPYTLNQLFDSDDHRHLALPDQPWVDQEFVIQYTSGTTGEPKGIVQTQEGHAHRMQTWAKTGELSANDRTLCMLALTHAYGADIITFPALSTGQTLYLTDIKDVTPAKVLGLIEAERITIFGSLPWFYREMIEAPAELTANVSSLRIAMCGATPLTQEIAHGFRKRFGKRINNSYGLTETCLITSNLFRTTDDPMTIGPVIDGVEAELRDCGVGIPDAGELVVRSKAFASRYFSKAAGPLWRDGWLYTGDLVRRDAGGNIYVLARVSEVIEVEGGKLLPFEVEEAIEKLPQVKDVAVVPVEDGSGRKKAGAFIVPRAELSEEDVKRHLEAHLPPHKLPAYIQFRSSFPKSVTGKISKAKLTLEPR
ncbi:MAG: class I adenylate-forming enzyme family protein [Kofleriaceae bacterium]